MTLYLIDIASPSKYHAVDISPFSQPATCSNIVDEMTPISLLRWLCFPSIESYLFSRDCKFQKDKEEMAIKRVKLRTYMNFHASTYEELGNAKVPYSSWEYIKYRKYFKFFNYVELAYDSRFTKEQWNLIFLQLENFYNFYFSCIILYNSQYACGNFDYSLQGRACDRHTSDWEKSRERLILATSINVFIFRR